jgi:Repeat of unknown function (DUF346)
MNTPWAVILCKFSDGDDEPFPKQYYKDLFTVNNTGSPWNMVRYFRDYSHGSLDLTGSQVFGWYKLTKSVADYNNLGQAARDQLIQWARAAAVTNGVDLNPFYKVVVCTNLWSDIGAASGVVAQGKTPEPAILGQEMGHVYGLNHSRIDGSDEDYKDPWDMMSGAATHTAPDPEFTSIGPGLNASNMRSMGWLDESRVWRVTGNNFDETITLRPLVRRDLPGFLAAEIPGYLVEFRVRDGWDGGIPRPAILIHRFHAGNSYLMPGRSGKHDLVAGDSFGDPEPIGAQVDLISNFKRLDVISIDAAAGRATLRMRYHQYGICAAMSSNRLTVFARTSHGTLTHKFYDPQRQTWTDWNHLGDGKISSAPSAVMAGNRLTVFARTAHGTLTHKFYDSNKGAWTDWIHLGNGQITSEPSAVMAGDRLTVFARTAHGTLTHKFYDSQQGAWTDWNHLGDGKISSAPCAVMAGNRLTVFARTAHGTLTHKFYDSSKGAWTNWNHLGDGQITSEPSAVMAGDRLTVFARTAHGTLTHKFYDSQLGAWTDWNHLGDGQISSAPCAVMAGKRLTVFARTAHGTLTHKFYDSNKGAWTDWIHLGDGQIT